MDTVNIPNAQAEMIDGPDGLQFVTRGTRSIPIVLFMLVWLAGWAAGEAFAISALLSVGTPLPAQAFLLLWLVFWSLGGLAALYTVLFQLVGRERLVLASDEIRARREVFGLGGWKCVPFDRVRGVRSLGSAMPEVARHVAHVLGVGGGGILVYTDGRPLRFGFALGPEECAAIVAVLRQRHAFPEAPETTDLPDHQPGSPHAA